VGTSTQGVVGRIVGETQQRHLSLVNSSRSKGVVERGKLIFFKLTTKTLLTTQALAEGVVAVGMEAPENADIQGKV
jgi:RNase P/RNase MRP subunit p29